MSVPRAIAEGEAFELVAVAGEGGLILYLDHYDSNAPVGGARIEVDSGAMRAFAVERDPGVYELPGESFNRPGTHPLIVSVQAGDTMDLLATTLVIEEPSRAHAGHVQPLPAWGWWVGGGMLAVALVGYAAIRRKAVCP
ncbi:MAG: hypothetical protein ACK4TK_01365 [Thiobacillaceae bacterium]